jgi:hypothetical protein
MPQKKVVYSKSDHDNDVKNFENFEAGKSRLDLSAFKRLMVHELCTNTDILRSYKIGVYPVERIQSAIENPSVHSTILIETSRYLMQKSQFYARLNNYFAKMGLFNYTIEAYDVKTDDLSEDETRVKFRNAYFNVNAEFEKMGFKHEMSKIMSILPVEDVYYGLIFEDTSDFFIQRMNPAICRICQIQDGVYNFKINLSSIDPIHISTYPDYIQQAYIDFRNHVAYHDGWYVPPAERQVCFKWNESCLYPMPMFISMIQDIMDLDVYKKLKLQKARVDNYKAIVIEVPIDDDAVDKPLLTDETLAIFAEMNKANMPDDIGLLHAPGSAEAVSFKDNTNNTNNLSDAITNIYDGAGVSSQVFNSGSSGTAMKLSIENDAAYIYAFYRQCERFFTRFIKLRKYNKTSYKFALKIQNSTVFNHSDVADSYLKASQNGLPFVIDYGVALGKTPSRILGSLFLENDVLDLHSRLIPLSTSYTMSSDSDSDNNGRPTSDDLDESGEKTRDSESYLNR